MRQIEYVETNRGDDMRHYLPDDQVRKYYDFNLKSGPNGPVSWTLVDKMTGRTIFTAGHTVDMWDVRFRLIEDERLPNGFMLIVFDDHRREILSDYVGGCYVEQIFFGDKSVKGKTADEFLAEPFKGKGRLGSECSLTEEDSIDIVCNRDIPEDKELLVGKLSLSNGAAILWVEFPNDSMLNTVIAVSFIDDLTQDTTMEVI